MTKKKLKPWDEALNQVAAELVAAELKRDHGVVEVEEALRGLADIFGISPELHARACRVLARRLNGDPINQAARKWLPKSWGGDEGELHVLTLMLWAACERRIEMDRHGPWESEDALAGQIASMMRWNPSYVMALLLNPERPEEADEEWVIDAEGLDGAEDAETAASWLIESVESFVMARESGDDV